ncbi:MAG: hypothetical protein A2Z99_20740 [Treponema sp. GWB1_62_6]|nr:MAG: hypothetical protein A2Z99_20740 [Treponema sp. GWB1_62_6]OHE68962.1 MAG: hypothetical protein A2001_06610 [Treponema sp. GWC1_61_84]
MAYHIDFQSLGFDYLKMRLTGEDLIPSQVPLRDGLNDNAAALMKAGIENLESLSVILESKKKLAELAEKSGVDAGYLNILGRALRGYRPKPHALADYPLIDEDLVGKLAGTGIRTSADLYDAAAARGKRSELAGLLGADESRLAELVRLSDLSRIQWVSPIFARLLHDAGYRTIKAVSSAKATDLCRDVAACNGRLGLFKGKIGERDMGRLVFLAAMLDSEVEE